MELQDFEQIGKRGFYRPSARVSFEQAVEMAASAMRHARAAGLIDLLVNSRGLLGFGPPTIFARHAFALEWVRSAGAALRVAIVVRPEIIDPQKIGVLMARNRGATGDVFTREDEALAWLDSQLVSSTDGSAGTAPGSKPLF
jgi:hypothetical protein